MGSSSSKTPPIPSTIPNTIPSNKQPIFVKQPTYGTQNYSKKGQFLAQNPFETKREQKRPAPPPSKRFPYFASRVMKKRYGLSKSVHEAVAPPPPLLAKNVINRRYGRNTTRRYNTNNSNSTKFTVAAAEAAFARQQTSPFETRTSSSTTALVNPSPEFRALAYRGRYAVAPTSAPVVPDDGGYDDGGYDVVKVVNNTNSKSVGGFKRTKTRKSKKSKKRIVRPLKKALALSRSAR
jgi:hypothetical protein